MHLFRNKQNKTRGKISQFSFQAVLCTLELQQQAEKEASYYNFSTFLCNQSVNIVGFRPYLAMCFGISCGRNAYGHWCVKQV